MVSKIRVINYGGPESGVASHYAMGICDDCGQQEMVTVAGRCPTCNEIYIDLRDAAREQMMTGKPHKKAAPFFSSGE